MFEVAVLFTAASILILLGFLFSVHVREGRIKRYLEAAELEVASFHNQALGHRSRRSDANERSHWPREEPGFINIYSRGHRTTAHERGDSNEQDLRALRNARNNAALNAQILLLLYDGNIDGARNYAINKMRTEPGFRLASGTAQIINIQTPQIRTSKIDPFLLKQIGNKGKFRRQFTLAELNQLSLQFD